MSAAGSTTKRPTLGSSPARVATALLGAAVVAVLVNAAVAAAAVALGADARFGPLQASALAAWSVGGVAIAVLGWVAIRRFAPDPARVLRWAIPGGLLASLVPDVLLLVTPLKAHSSTTGVLALMLMHVVVTAVSVSALARVLPVSGARR